MKMERLPEAVPAAIPAADRAAVSTVLAAFAFSIALSWLAFPAAWMGMVRVWMDSETYTHGFIALPFAAWMIWRNRGDWSMLPVRSFMPGLVLVAGFAALWVVGRVAGVASVEQFGAVAVIPAAMAALTGLPIVAALAFPLAFLFFAVPVGDFLTPILMDYTADATVLALQWTGIPVYREGLHFMVPTGRWSVVEACSGLRYLIASLALGVLFAYLQFRTLKYRLAFIALSIVVPIVANWIRAYMIVMIGHLSSNKLAAGADHLIYGWVFFGIVMGLVFWIGSLWRGPAPSALAGGGSLSAGPASSPASAHLLAFVLGTAVLAGTAAGAVRLMDQGEATVRIQAFEPLLAPMTAPLPAGVYQPSYGGGVAGLSGWIGEEAPVGLRLVQYVKQHRHGEMITYENGVNPGRADSGQHWRVSARAGIDPRSLGAAFPAGIVNEYQIAGPTGRYLVWEWFWVNGRVLADPMRVKLFTAYDLLRGQGDESLAWVLWTPIDGPMEAARDRLVKANGRLQSRVQAAGL